MADSGYETITTDVTDGIMTLTLNRPDRMNAFTIGMLREMISAFDHADADDDVRVVIVTGAGRGFCAGADLAAGASSFDYDELIETAGSGGGSDAPTVPAERSDDTKVDAKVNGELRDGGGLLTLRIFRCTKPVIAAINGAAVGVGATMCLPMDIRLASTASKFGFVFAARGIVPEACSSWFLPRLVGISQAAEWCFTARVFGAEEALAGGLVRSLHEPDELMVAARALATEIVTNAAPVSVALSRMMLWRMLGADHPMEAHRIDSRAVNATGRGADAREGIAAFFEKRPAEWTMRPSLDMPPFVPWWDEPRFE